MFHAKHEGKSTTSEGGEDDPVEGSYSRLIAKVLTRGPS